MAPGEDMDLRSPAGSAGGAPGVSARARWRWILYLLLLAACVTLLAVRLMPGHAGRAARALAGETGQSKPISVRLERGDHVEALATQLVALCENGRTWKIDWSPDSARIAFRATAGAVAVRERQTRTYPDGTVGRISASTSARVAPGGTSALGDARMIASFSHPGRRTLNCDSGYVHWRAAQGGPPVAAAPPGGDHGSYYPAVPSLAGNISPARRAFAARVDQTCVTSYNRMRAREAWARARYAGRRDAAKRGYLAHLVGHAQQYVAIRRLGRPPDGRALYGRWLANVHQRVILDRRWFRAWQRHARRAQAATAAEMNFLKLRGDVLGQRFGLRVCTSNGPFDRPVPVPQAARRSGAGPSPDSPS